MMKPRTFSSRITLAFSFVAVLIMAAQMFLFYDMVLVAEDSVIGRRLELYSQLTTEGFEQGLDKDGVLEIDLLTTAYRKFELLPESVRALLKPDWTGLEEVEPQEDIVEYMVYSMPDPLADSGDNIYILSDVTLVESTEAQRYMWTGRYGLLSAFILGLTCLIILYTSRRLTSPLRTLEQALRDSSADDHSLLALPGGAPLEVYQLAASLNAYRMRIGELIERERSFSRYASHELRTPLTVIRGVASLLEVSSEPVFVRRQTQRLLTAATGMNDVIETLLNLAREERDAPKVPLIIDKTVLDQVVEDHAQLLRGKPVSTRVTLSGHPSVKVPESVIRILLSNLVRNAMACTREGEVLVAADEDSLCIVDSGCGLDTQPDGHEGFGLGLLIVNDICRKYGWEFSLINNESGQGCTARIVFEP